MKPLWREWKKVAQRIESSGQKLLLLDFDGTLVPIAPTPQSVKVSRKIMRLLRFLSARKDYVVAVVSGRSLKNIRQYFRIPRVIYIGNHGLELKGKGLRLSGRARSVRKQCRAIRLMAQRLRKAFLFWPGVLVENKFYTLSLHFRGLSRDQNPAFDARVRSFKNKHRKFPVAWQKGKSVWEIAPEPGWGKGEAALHLAGCFPCALPVALGDDRTDEDMFESLKNKGVTIRVGRPKRSQADYFLTSQAQTEIFLERLCRCR